MRNNLFIVQLLNMCKMDDNIPVLNNISFYDRKWERQF